MKTLKCVSKYPDDNTVAAELSFDCTTPFLYFPPFYAQEILVTSLNDITIVCSVILVGKPLHMHRRSANGCLHTCQHPRQLTILTESTECHHFVSKPFVPVTLSPRYFGVPSYCRTILLTKLPVHIKTNTIMSIQMKLGGINVQRYPKNIYKS